MANPSPMRVPGTEGPHPAKVAVKLEKPAEDPSKVAEVSAVSPRRLIRPGLPVRTIAARNVVRNAPVLSSALRASVMEPQLLAQQASHAETFYLQKQVQAQKLMVFVLDDSERIEGYIEWYDRNALKVRHGSKRTLIYKSCIKYLYKAENTAI